MSVYLLFELLRECRAVVDYILEARGEVDFRRPVLGEEVECVVRQCGCAVLHHAREVVDLPRYLREPCYGVEVDLDLCYGAVGQDDSAVGGPCLDAYLAYALPPLWKGGEEAVHECPELFLGRVLAADLAYFPANGYGSTGRVVLPFVLGKNGGGL